MKLKKFYDLSNILFDNYTLLQVIKNFMINPFFIVLSLYNISNYDILNLKNELFKYDAKSMVIKAKYIKILFSNSFAFIKSSCMFIFINNMMQFFNIIKILKNLIFFYSFNKCFSNITNSVLLLEEHNIYEYYIIFHYIIFKLINNIILIILIYISLFINLLKKV
jgi:hypothetical protein